MQIRVLVCSVVLSSICIGQTGTTSPAPPQAGAPSSASKGAITFDLVLTLKALGDEYFIAGDRGAASAAYTRAQNELKALDPKATSYPPVKIDLATKELEYRQLLLSRGYDFWGTGVDSGPISPRAHLAEMKFQLDGLKETATLIGAKIDAIATDTTTSSNIKALEAAVDGQIGKTQIEDQKAEQVQDYAAARIDELGARLKQIRTEQDRNATIAQQANEKLKQLENSTNGLILSQVAQLTGLPIDVGAFASGDVKSQVKAIGLSLLSNKSSKFHDSLESLSGQAAKVGDLVKRAEDLKKQVEQGQVLIAHVSDVLRKPTVEGLLTAGQEVMAQLPTEVQQSLVQQIKDSKPLLPLVELARSRPDVRKAVLIAANQAGVNLASFEQITSTVVGRHRSEMLSWYKDVLTRTAAASPTSVEPILSAYMRVWPQQFVDQLPAEVRSAVFKALKVEVQGTVRELQRKVGNLDQIVSDALPQSILEDGIAKAVGAKTASFDTIVGAISDPARQKQIFTDLASESVAAIASSAVLRDPATPFRSSKRDFSDVAGTVGKQAPASATPDQNQMMGSLAIGVLGKAVPAVAAAQAVAQIVGNLFEMGAQFDKISEANSEIKRLMIEEVHVQDILEESRLNHALALYDREIAQLGTRVAFEERDLYRVGLRNQAEQDEASTSGGAVPI